MSLYTEGIDEGEADKDGIALREEGHIKVPRSGYTVLPAVVRTTRRAKSGTKPEKDLAIYALCQAKMVGVNVR